MESKPFVVFRADADENIGSGHVFRCLALADAFSRFGWHCAFATATSPPKALTESGFEIGPRLPENEPDALAEVWPSGCDLLVIDHYEKDLTFENSCRPWAKHLMAIEDVANRTHDCEFLLDSNATRSESDYAGLIVNQCSLLLGPAFVPLRREFAHRRQRAAKRLLSEKEPYRLLITLGGTAQAEFIQKVLEATDQIKLSLAIDIISTDELALRGHISAVQRPNKVKLHNAVSEMDSVIMNSDLAIGAAGINSWERCCLGLPSLVVAIADNQLENARNLVAAGAADQIYIKDDSAVIRDRILSLIQDPENWGQMSRNAFKQCDGLGAVRVAEAVNSRLLRPDEPRVNLRPIQHSDGERLYEWQNDRRIRQYSRNPNSPSREQHFAWVDRKLSDPASIASLILFNGSAAGVVRLDWCPSQKAFEVSILIDPGKQGEGIGLVALEQARRLVMPAKLVAYIQPKNQASLTLFRRAGYLPSGKQNWFTRV